MRGLPPACTTPASDGMVVKTNTPQLQEFRRGVLELILTEHPHVCLHLLTAASGVNPLISACAVWM